MQYTYGWYEVMWELVLPLAIQGGDCNTKWIARMIA